MAEDTVKQAGRNTLCTPEMIAEFVKIMFAGNYFECACAYCGIDEGTGYNWKKWGKEALLKAELDLDAVPEGNDRAYATFFKSTEEAAAKAEVRMAAQVQLGGQDRVPPILRDRDGNPILDEDGNETKLVPGDPRSNQWFLEKRFQRRWGMKTEKHELSGPDGGPIQQEIGWFDAVKKWEAEDAEDADSEAAKDGQGGASDE